MATGVPPVSPRAPSLRSRSTRPWCWSAWTTNRRATPRSSSAAGSPSTSCAATSSWCRDGSPPRPPVDDEIRQAVLAAIDSRQYILGPQCRELEAELARHTGTKHAVLTSSATAALWMILRALGVTAGDEILVPSHTAFPTVEAICFAGGTPVFVDADDWYTLDPKDAATRVTPRT